MTSVVILRSKWCLPESFAMGTGCEEVKWWYSSGSMMLGLWFGLISGYVMECYTSHNYAPVREIAETQKQSAATSIIYGLALGYLSYITPVLCFGVIILVAHNLGGMFGVSLGAMGMLGTMEMGLTTPTAPSQKRRRHRRNVRHAGDDARAYGPLGRSRQCHCGHRQGRRDRIRALGGLGSPQRAHRADAGDERGHLGPWDFTGLLLGALMPYAFAAGR